MLVDELTGRLREQHLAAVGGGGDSSRAMDVEPDVVVFGDEGLAGVEPHAHAHRPVRERLLPRASS